MNFNQTVTDYINNGTAEQIEILERLRELIHQNIEDVSEEIKWGIPVFEKNKIFTYFRITKKHVALGFYNIDRINDTEGVLEGTGKTMRHLKLKTKEDLNEKKILEWLLLTAE